MTWAANQQRGLPYRRRIFMARRRRRSLLARLIKPFVVAALLVGSPAVLTAWVLTSAEFTLREIVVRSGEQVPESWVQSELAVLQGYPIFKLQLGQIERHLVTHPWVREAVVRKRLPDQLRVKLAERRPAAVLRLESELLFVDIEGVAFAPFDPAIGPADLLLLSGGSRPAELRRALEVARRVERAEPTWAAALSEIEILNHSDFRLFCAILPFPVIVTRDRLEEGLESLRFYLPEIEPHEAAVGAIDLRFEQYVVIKPAKER
jgi:cell division septal protein FtsQ